MNDLSWLIYLADVLPAFSSVLVQLAGISCGGYIIIRWFANLQASDAEHPFDIDPSAENYRPISGKVVVALCSLILLGYLVPSSKETYYAIAASEIGEEIVESETTGKVLKALNNWLDEQLEQSQEPVANTKGTHQ